MKNSKLITLDVFNPLDLKNPLTGLMHIQHLGRDEKEIIAIDDEVLLAIIEAYGEEGENEIMRMVDRGQISLDDAIFILGDKYETVSKRVPCEWND